MALLQNSGLRRDCPFSRWAQGTRTISAVPRAGKRFMSAKRIWISEVWRSGSQALIRSPRAFRQRIFASMRLRAWYPIQRFRNARRWCRVARRGSFRTIAARKCSFPGRPFLRMGMIGVACLSVRRYGNGGCHTPRQRSRCRSLRRPVSCRAAPVERDWRHRCGA